MSLDLKKVVADKIQEMQPSATIAMAQKARDLAASGVKVISLSLGEPDFDTPQFIKDAAIEGLQKGYTKYTPVPGLIELRTAISNKLKRENNLDYDVNQIVVSNGAKQSIANICSAVLDPGDEVIIFTPYWVSYEAIVKINGGVPVMLKASIDQDFKVSPAQLEAAITERTRLIVFSSPCNPTGTTYSQQELDALAQVIVKYDDLVVVSDEIYEYINFSDRHGSIVHSPGMKDITAVINGMSKGFAMTGWRLGYMAAPVWLAKACAKVQSQCTSGATSFGQYAAAKALDAGRPSIQYMVDTFKGRKHMVIDLLSAIPGIKVNDPQGAFYLFPDVSAYFGKSDGESTIRNADDFAEVMLMKAHVGLVTGSAFGDDNCVRISYAAADEDLKTAMNSIAKVLANFK